MQMSVMYFFFTDPTSNHQRIRAWNWSRGRCALDLAQVFDVINKMMITRAGIDNEHSLRLTLSLSDTDIRARIHQCTNRHHLFNSLKKFLSRTHSNTERWTILINLPFFYFTQALRYRFECSFPLERCAAIYRTRTRSTNQHESLSSGLCSVTPLWATISI